MRVREYIFLPDAEARTDCNRRNGDPSAAGHDVSCRSSRPAQCACTYLGQDAQAFHPDCTRRQSFIGAFPLRSDESANHFPRTVAARFRVKKDYSPPRLPKAERARILGMKNQLEI